MQTSFVHKPIEKLPPELIAKIAAGEVIKTPVCLIKECLENAVDARADEIKITVVKGGAEKIVLEDNGVGIAKEDFPLVCERFATSKLSSYNDLRKIQTFGFRGEALSAINQVACLTLISRTAQHKSGFKTQFIGGKASEVTPAARECGTTFIAENLFYNFPLRKKSIKPTKTTQEIICLVKCFSVNFPGINFIIRSKELSFTKEKTDRDRRSIISSCFGVKETLEFIELKSEAEFSVVGKLYFSNPFNDVVFERHFDKRNFKNKFVFFVNNRLITFPKLKNVLKEVYRNYTLKDRKVFFFMSVFLAPEKLDQNVHPAKEFVEIENEFLFVNVIKQKVFNQLENLSKKKVFMVNAVNSASLVQSKSEYEEMKEFLETEIYTETYTEEKQENKDSFTSSFIFAPTPQSENKFKVRKKMQSLPDFALSQEINKKLKTEKIHKENKESVFAKYFSNLLFIGLFDQNIALVQKEEDLLALKVLEVTKEVISQFLKSKFLTPNYNKRIEARNELFEQECKLEVFLEDAFMHYLDDPEANYNKEEDEPKDELVLLLLNTLTDNKEALQNFGILIENQKLVKVPLYFSELFEESLGVKNGLDIYRKNVVKLLFKIAVLLTTDEESEVSGQETNSLIVLAISVYLTGLYKEILNNDEKVGGKLFEHVILPLTNTSSGISFEAPNWFVDKKVLKKITDVRKLFKIFERC